MDFIFPWSSLFGGMLLGISALALLYFNGKIAGISGILSGLIRPVKLDFLWRLIFLIGMMLGGLLGRDIFAAHIPGEFDLPTWQLIAAGLLVGIGTKLGNGCTSGHGICGMGRLSIRSIAATCVFMVVAIITTFINLHVFG